MGGFKAVRSFGRAGERSKLGAQLADAGQVHAHSISSDALGREAVTHPLEVEVAPEQGGEDPLLGGRPGLSHDP